MFINFYFPLRAPGGILAEVHRLSTKSCNFSKYPLATISPNFHTNHNNQGGDYSKNGTYFYFL